MKLDNFFVFLPEILELDVLEQPPSGPNFKKKFDFREIYLVSDILTNFHEDPIIRSTKKLPFTDTCN